MGVTLTAASATATIADNTLTTIEGQLEAAVTYQGEPTFQVVGEALTFDVAAQRLPERQPEHHARAHLRR